MTTANVVNLPTAACSRVKQQAERERDARIRHQASIDAALQDLLLRNRAGKLDGLGLVVKWCTGKADYGVVGSYRENPPALIGELAIFQAKVTNWSEDFRDDID